jgi:hypothetical protein
VKVLVAAGHSYIGAVMILFLGAGAYQADGPGLYVRAGCDLGSGPEDIGPRPPGDH